MPTRTRHPVSAQPSTPTPQFLRLKSALQITGLGRSTIFRLVASKDFPAPVRVGVRAVAWRKSDLDLWSETRESVIQ